MSGDRLYHLFARALDAAVWRGKLIGDVELPAHGPAVFVANHAGAMGPIAVTASLPLRLYSWIIEDMVDFDTAGPYLRKDFLDPEVHAPRQIAAPLSSALARIAVPLLRAVGCIPVLHDRGLLETLRISDEHLAAGRCLLVFPEDPQLPVDGRTGMRPFKTGFAHLGSLHFARTHQCLRFYPIAVRRAEHTVQVGVPIPHDALNPEAGERGRVARLLESAIASMLTAGNDLVNDTVGAAG